MSIKLSAAAGAAGMTRAQIAALATVGVLGMGGSGVLVYRLAAGPREPAAAPMSKEEAKLAEKVEERRARADADAHKLHQQDLGQGYRFDGQGNLIGASAESKDLPRNKSLQEAGAPRGTVPMAAIARGIDRGAASAAEPAPDRSEDDDLDDIAPGRGDRGRDDDGPNRASEGADRPAVRASMLGYSTVAGASWATRRPESIRGGESGKSGGEGVWRRQGISGATTQWNAP